MIPLDQAQSRITSALDHLKQELASIRTGRANPAMLEGIQVEAYGSKSPINQVGGINVLDAAMITIQPWDKSIINGIASAVNDANIGVSAVVDGDIVRVSFPPLTEERRKEYVKLMKDKVEDGRIEIRVIRKDVMSWLDAQSFSEDDKKAKEKQLQDMVDEANKQIEEIREKKETDLMTV